MALLLDCRQGWKVSEYRVDGWRAQTLQGPVPFDEKSTKDAALKYPEGHLAILDYEHWKLPDETDNYIQVVDWWREVRPELRIGFYGVLPQNAYWPSIAGGAQKEQWKQHNASLGRVRNKRGQWSSRGLVDVVDFLVPDLYNKYPNADGWDHESLWFSRYAPATIEACRAYQKPIYPFIWQRIEFGNNDSVSDDIFKRQIQYCLDNADGACVWDWADESTGNDMLERTSKIMGEFA